jgi:dihydrofolate reductase
MRKIIAFAFVTIDGVMQAPGSPKEDTSGGFEYGGWNAPYDDEASGQIMKKLLEPADLLLGRSTYEIFAPYWPEHADYWPGINDVTKYVVSTTVEQSDWKNTVFLKTIDEVEALRNSDGSDIKMWGSSKLHQSLLSNNLIDELWLFIHPVILGKGKKLFNNDAIPAAYELQESQVTPGGVIIANYHRTGEVKTGTVG